MLQMQPSSEVIMRRAIRPIFIALGLIATAAQAAVAPPSLGSSTA
jgi:hypothetical protein